MACDYDWQFIFKIANVTGSANTAADCLFKLELKVTQKIRFKIREEVKTIPIEATTSSSEISVEGQFFSEQTNGDDEMEEQTLEQKE